ncbi:MAG: NADH-quinone oxidoreductase subunit C [Erysipelotrichaceae bacterium]|nr:NADH-quinone oxidoreductase subunit C [Erysipelotrichaceae bacterium]
MRPNREYKIEEIDLGDLLLNVLDRKNRGERISQICAAYVDGKYELSYSFIQDGLHRFTTLRVICDLDTEVPSITEIYPMAVFYENEMKELYGVNVKYISLDYNNKLYRIEKETPFLPKEKK